VDFYIYISLCVNTEKALHETPIAFNYVVISYAENNNVSQLVKALDLVVSSQDLRFESSLSMQTIF
jgi:hypothetical protein